MRAGELRHRVTIQEQDGAGAAWNGSQTWSTYKTVWAKIVPVRGRESLDAGTKKEQAEVTHLITMRYVSGLDPDMRISFDDRYFHFEVIRNIDERNAWIEIEAREEADVGG